MLESVFENLINCSDHLERQTRLLTKPPPPKIKHDNMTLVILTKITVQQLTHSVTFTTLSKECPWNDLTIAPLLYSVL